MLNHQDEFTMAALSRVLRVTRQGYHAWLQREPSERALADAVLRVKIRAIHRKSRRSYGSRRVRTHLRRKERCAVGRHRVRRLMAQEGLPPAGIFDGPSARRGFASPPIRGTRR
jgi:transposase InsO family protein